LCRIIMQPQKNPAPHSAAFTEWSTTAIGMVIRKIQTIFPQLGQFAPFNTGLSAALG